MYVSIVVTDQQVLDWGGASAGHAGRVKLGNAERYCTSATTLLSSQKKFCLVFLSLKTIAPCFAARKFSTTKRVQRNGIGTAGRRSAHTPV